MGKTNLKNIDLDLLRHFLEKTGWNINDSNYDALDIFTAPKLDDEGNNIEVVLPNKKEVPGIENYLWDTINVISALNDEELSESLNLIKNLDFDLHNYRLLEQTDSISLPLLQSLIDAKKSALKDAVQYEHQNYYYNLSAKKREDEKPPTEKAKNFIDKCRFPHTWSGSFGITIELPLDQISLGLFPDGISSETLGRKVSYRFFKGFELFRKAYENKSKSYVLDHIDSKEEISFFKYFQNLMESIRNNVFDFKINMSPTMKGESYEEANKRPVRIDKNTIKYLFHTFEQIDEPDESQEITFLGFPTTLKSDRESLLNDLIDSERWVRVKGESKEIDASSLRFKLSLDDYKKALKAQEENLTVRVICDVVKAKRGWDVESVKKFELLE